MSIEDQEKKFKRALTRKISARNKKLNKKSTFLKKYSYFKGTVS
jgi:hypothetical protein